MPEKNSEICLLLGEWVGDVSCMTHAEWASWLQAVGSLLALVIAIGVPWRERRIKKRQDSKMAEHEADITIRFHSEVFHTNEQMLRVAIKRLDKTSYSFPSNSHVQVTDAIGSLRAVAFEQIKIIAAHDPLLAKHLADFHCELDLLKGFLNRNDQKTLLPLAADIKTKLKLLSELSEEIKSRTVPGWTNPN